MTRIAISVLTGFLGSGKTTILRELLAHPELDRTVVLVNEFGAIGIDDLLLKEVAPHVVLLESGCICCTVGDDLTARLLELLAQRDAGDIPPFERAIVETTGLADPAPLLHSIMTGPIAAAPFRLGGVITTVDAVNGARQLDTHAESVKQAALADRLIITKCDLADAAAITALRDRLQRINPTAVVYETVDGHIEPQRILDTGLWNAASRRVDVDRWLNDRSLSASYTRRTGGSGSMLQAQSRHSAVSTIAMTRDSPLRLEAFTDAVEHLLACHGDHLLRVKGILNVEGADGPVVVHGVQRIFHPPVRLASWPSADRRSRVVFIARDIEPGAIENALRPVMDGVALPQ
jgi:G3E family GTPase